jgi:hypothetical protein
MRKVKTAAAGVPNVDVPKSEDDFLTDEEVARRVKNGELVPFDSVPVLPREEVLREIRERVRNWRKPPLKQDRPA